MASQLLLQRTIKTLKHFRLGVLSLSLTGGNRSSFHSTSNVHHHHHQYGQGLTSDYNRESSNPFLSSLENEVDWWYHYISLSSLAFYIYEAQKVKLYCIYNDS